MAFSFELMQDVGLPKPKARPEGIPVHHLSIQNVLIKRNFPDIVNMDLKSTLRVLYNLFTKYRNAA